MGTLYSKEGHKKTLRDVIRTRVLKLAEMGGGLTVIWYVEDSYINSLHMYLFTANKTTAVKYGKLYSDMDSKGSVKNTRFLIKKKNLRCWVFAYISFK